MHTYTKQPQSIADQISTLKQRGLVFNDDSTAIQKLGVISYFRLANYWKPFESDKVNHLFKPDSKFENVLSLYNFDKELRCLLFSAIQSIKNKNHSDSIVILWLILVCRCIPILKPVHTFPLLK